jgi:hypothetical protein
MWEATQPTGENKMPDTQIAALTGQMFCIKHLLTTLIARHAGEYADPEEYIMTLLAPLSDGISALDTSDPGTAAMARAIDDMQQSIETGALQLLR